MPKKKTAPKKQTRVQKPKEVKYIVIHNFTNLMFGFGYDKHIEEIYTLADLQRYIRKLSPGSEPVVYEIASKVGIGNKYEII